MPTLSICLITKNEEAHLRRCLESVRGLWDDLVVVDTGSSDRTVAIAAAFGARLFTFAWQDDFSLARNFCIAQATGDWILSLDADETIATRDHAVIRDLLRRDELDAVTAFQRHYVTSTPVGWQPGPGGYEEGEPYPGFVDVKCRRLFRNRASLRFQKPVHEELVSLDPQRPLVETHGPWVIHHFGKLTDEALLRAKWEGYLRIGARKIAESPESPQAHYEQGVQHGELKQPEEALACFERVRALDPGFRDIDLRIAMCHVRLGAHEPALAALRLAARNLPQHRAVIALEEGNVHRARGDDAAAEAALLRALSANRGFAAASLNLALLYQRTGRPAEALACLDRGLERNAHHPQMLMLRAQVRRASGNDAGALQDLERLGADSAALRLRARILAQQRRFAAARECLAAVGETDAEMAALRGAVALGLGEVSEAVARLQESLALQGTHEAALNLSVALEKDGDRRGALGAVAEALTYSPGDATALARFTRLAGGMFRQSSERDMSGPLTLFFYQPRSIAFDGRTPRTRGLGGTESAIVYLAEALTRRGHRVVVFNTCDAPGVHYGVEYVGWESLPVRAVADLPDVVIAVRDWQGIGATRFAPLQVFWTGDAFDQPFVRSLANAQHRDEIDFLMLQSDWQSETFQAHHDIPAWQVLRTRLGAAASAIDVTPAEKTTTIRPRRLAYASTPFRGLDVLLDLFPRIRAACPDAELDVFSSMQVYGVAPSADRAQFGALYRKSEQPGVTLVGSLPQAELAARLQQARVLAYPNHYAETFCIAAIEAQAAGCAVVTSALGALPETVGDGGICIPGDPRSAAYQEAFVNACVTLLTDDERWLAASARASSRAWGDYRWSAIAEEWETQMRAALRPEPPLIARIAVHLDAGRAGLAHKMLQREPAPPGVSEEAWSALQGFTAWRAGVAEAPAEHILRAVSVHFRSLRAVLRSALQSLSVQPL